MRLQIQIQIQIPILGFALLLLAPIDSRAATALELRPMLSSPQPVGTTVLWRVVGAGSEGFTYRFSVGMPPGPFRMVRDFGTGSVVDWTPIEEGAYAIQAEVRDATGATTPLVASFTISRIAVDGPVVAPTAHPLVALYSAPPCESAGWVRVGFNLAGSTQRQLTPWKPCRADRSASLLVAGMRGDSVYQLQHEIAITGGGGLLGPALQFQTGPVPADAPDVVVTDPADAATSRAESVVLFSMQYNSIQPTYMVAADLAGRIVWYYDRLKLPWMQGAYLLRPIAGGTMLFVTNDEGVWTGLREIDLAGNTLRATNTVAVSEQLVARGHDSVIGFHHDAIRLANGHTLVLAAAERILTDVQGPGAVDVLGDILVDLDEDWRVSWVWNSFDQLDPRRIAILQETCSGPAQGCPKIVRAPIANDWTHTNSIERMSDGNLILSVRNQDWVIKIDYRDGQGTGAVLWRLGPAGDFTLDAEPGAWFSHQHDASFEGGKLVLYDNSNTRCVILDPLPCNSRGIVLDLDEEQRTAHVALSVDLGNYSEALGSAQRLANGNYHFLSGLARPVLHGESLEVRPDGTRTFMMASRSTYRSFRMRGLYAP